MFFTLAISLLTRTVMIAQTTGTPPQTGKTSFPFTISVFTESVGLPGFRFLLQNPNWGVRIGTEWRYRNRNSGHLLQTVNLGYYSHHGLHDGFYLNTEFGYRRFVGRFFADATIGGGYLHLVSHKRFYDSDGQGGFQPASRQLHKFSPTLGLGMGYQFAGNASVFTRYELFGEMPFSNSGAPVLPHRALHVGTRLPF